MLLRLNFQLTAPNAFVFIKRFAKVAGIATTPRSTTELLANYLLELTLQDYKMLKYLPSTICASAIYLALKTRGKTPWTPDLEKHSTYKEADLQACVRDIHELHEKATTNSLQAVRKKYFCCKYGNVSSIAVAHLDGGGGLSQCEALAEARARLTATLTAARAAGCWGAVAEGLAMAAAGLAAAGMGDEHACHTLPHPSQRQPQRPALLLLPTTPQPPPRLPTTVAGLWQRLVVPPAPH